MGYFQADHANQPADQSVENFLLEDALVSLAAIRMALSWVREDGVEGLGRIDNELAGLQARTSEIARALRADQQVSPAPFQRHPMDTIAAEGAKKPFVETPQITPQAPEPPTKGLAPEWLTDIEDLDTDLPAPLDLGGAETPQPVIDLADAPEAPIADTIAKHPSEEDLGSSIEDLLASAMADRTG